MIKELTILNKIIKIYILNDNESNELPLIIYNSYSSSTDELFDYFKSKNLNGFIFVTVSNLDWDSDMTPWPMEPLYKNDEMNGLADNYISELINKIIPEIEKEIKNLNLKISYYAISGYSLAGLFSIYSLYKTNIFNRCAAISPSLWYINFKEYIKTQEIPNVDKIYLSLGEKEKLSKNKYLKTVEENTTEIYNFYKKNNIDIIFELNDGGHFNDELERITKGIYYIISNN